MPGEFFDAVNQRFTASYIFWSDSSITHPILPSYREGTRVVAQLTHYQRPIIALTSQVGEVAVVRTPVSYKCGWGSDNIKNTPSLTLPAGEGTRAVAQLTHFFRPVKITSLRGGVNDFRSSVELAPQKLLSGFSRRRVGKASAFPP